MNKCVTYLFAVMAMLCCLVAYACSQKEEFYPELSILANGEELSGSSLTYDERGGSDAIEIKSNGEWKVECNADWINLSPRSGRGNGSVNVEVTPSESSRSCVVTISMSEMAQMRHSFNVIQYVTEKPNEPDQPSDPETPSDPNNPDGPTDPDNPANPDEPADPENPDEPSDPSDPDNPDDPNQPSEPENPENPENPEQPEEPAPTAITIPELISLMSDDGTPTIIDAERDRILTAMVMNNLDGANFSASHLILATEGATSPNNGVVLYGRIVKPATLGLNCGDKVEVLLKAGIAVAVKNNSVMYEVTGDASKQWAEVRILSRGGAVPVTDIKPSQMQSYQGMAVRLRAVTPQSEGVWYEPVGKGNITFKTSDGETFVVQVLESAKFASRQYHIAQGDICGVVAVDGDKVVLRPRSEADIIAFDGPAPEEPEQPEEPENPEEPDQPSDPEEPEQPENPENPENPDDSGDKDNSDNKDDSSDKEDSGDKDDSGNDRCQKTSSTSSGISAATSGGTTVSFS